MADGGAALLIAPLTGHTLVREVMDPNEEIVSDHGWAIRRARSSRRVRCPV
jgi:hypothetical protein